MTEIIISEKYKLKDDGTQYELYVFDGGGKEVRVVATGEMKLSEPQWKKPGLYFRTLSAACKRITRMEASQGDVVSIQEYIQRLEDVEKEIEAVCSGK